MAINLIVSDHTGQEMHHTDLHLCALYCMFRLNLFYLT